MISKLASLGYIKYNRYEIIQLTDSGQKIGKYLLQRHETVESFLALIGNRNPLKETELIEHSLSPSTISDLDDLLEYFRRNPAMQQDFTEFKKSRKTEEV
jgi:Mn-dependent DtxR family transcriptional regulator